MAYLDMNRTLERIASIRSSGNVKRYHTQQTIKENLVSTHSWNVTVLICVLHENPSKELLLAAMFHDSGEYISGDTPWTAKQLDKELGKRLKHLEGNYLKSLDIDYYSALNENEKTFMKCCDMLELTLFCLEEMKLGNRGIWPVFERGISSLRQSANTPEVIRHILDIVEEEARDI